jgi:hypothetical protein
VAGQLGFTVLWKGLASFAVHLMALHWVPCCAAGQARTKNVSTRTLVCVVEGQVHTTTEHVMQPCRVGVM